MKLDILTFILLEVLSIGFLGLFLSIPMTQPMELCNSILCGVGSASFIAFIIFIAVTFYHHFNDDILTAQDIIDNLESACNDLHMVNLEYKARVELLFREKQEIEVQYHNYKTHIEEDMNNLKDTYRELQQNYEEAVKKLARNGL